MRDWMKQEDKASYRNKGGVVQKIRNLYYQLRYCNYAGGGISVRKHVEFALTDNAFVAIGENCVIREYAYFQLTKPAPKLIIGNGVVIGRNCMITIKDELQIGDHTIIGGYVQIIDHNHSCRKNELIKEQKAEIKPIRIGRDVWIGSGAKILCGVTIGDGAVIGANAVVNKDIPAYAVAAGVPAKVVRYRT